MVPEGGEGQGGMGEGVTMGRTEGLSHSGPGVSPSLRTGVLSALVLSNLLTESSRMKYDLL